MKEITLTQSKIALVDNEDYELVKNYKWCFDGKYAKTKINNKTVYMHRLILNTPPNKFTDHIDGNGLNNTRENIRECTNSENQLNRTKQSNNSSGFKGVITHKQTHNGKTYEYIQARIKLNGKRISLGYFNTVEDAAIAYNEAMKNNPFAKLNTGL